MAAESGDAATAAAHLWSALEVWMDTDPEFEKAKEARDKLSDRHYMLG